MKLFDKIILKKSTYLKLNDTSINFDLLVKELQIIEEEIGANFFDMERNSFSNPLVNRILISIKKGVNNLSKNVQQKINYEQQISEISSAVYKKYENENTFYNVILSKIVKFLKTNQAGLFLINDKENDDYQIELKACYAYDKKRFVNNEFNKGEGLVGQCILEKETLHITELPQFYFNITSGLGEATPNSMVLVPLVANSGIIGVLEIASFEKFDSNKIILIEKIAKIFADKIEDINNEKRISSLYNKALEQEQNLKSKEQLLNDKIKELEKIYNEIKLKNIELENVKAEQQMLLESKLATQRQSYELIISTLKRKIKQPILN